MATPDSAASLADKLIAAAHAERLASARSLAKHYVLAAAGTALIPLPLAGLGAFMALQVKLVHGLATHYEVPFKENLARSLIAALLSGASWMVGMIGLASLAKAVPGLGSLAGGGGMAVTSASVTYAVGEVFIQHFEAGGTLLDFDPDKMKALFRRALKNGPATVAASFRSAGSPPGAGEKRKLLRPGLRAKRWPAALAEVNQRGTPAALSERPSSRNPGCRSP